MAIVMTGMGVQSPLGCSFGECLESIRNGSRCIDDIQNIDTSGFPMKAAGEVRRNHQVVKTPAQTDRRIHFLDNALIQLREATQFHNRYTPGEIILNVGSGVDYVDFEAYFNNKDYEKPHSSALGAHYKTGLQIKELARKHRIEGGCHIFVAACVASTQAMGLSFRMLQKGIRKALITGGSESMMSAINYLGFYQLGVMASGYEAPEACRPFDNRRTGTVLGEGALVMLLEDSSRAEKQNILAEICGYGSTMDAHAVTDPDPSGASLAKAIALALEDAGIAPDDIDCAHLHGTGTPKNAPAEYKALKHIFGSRASDIPVFSLKGQMGHLIGACGAMEMLGVIHSLQEQVIMPTVNFSEPDKEAPLHVVRHQPLHLPIRYILKINTAFGGQNTAFIIKKHEE